MGSRNFKFEEDGDMYDVKEISSRTGRSSESDSDESAPKEERTHREHAPRREPGRNFH